MSSPLALEVCELFCGAASSLWPKPTGHLSLSKSVVQLDPDQISAENIERETRVGRLLEMNMVELRKNAKKSGNGLPPAEAGGTGMLVRFTGLLDLGDVKLTLHTDESYTLTIMQPNEGVRVAR